VQPLLVAEDKDLLAARLGVSAMALANYRPRYNIAPQQEHFIVTTEYENRKLAPAQWGLVSNPGEHGRAKYSINAKAETVESRPTFAEAFTHRRCVIPANGFYEWTGPKYAGSRFGFTAATATSSCLLASISMEKTTTTAPGQPSPF
jgi:putative SOS response-associated peptidase YedK